MKDHQHKWNEKAQLAKAASSEFANEDGLWKKSASGRIFRHLNFIAMRNASTVKVVGKGTPLEVYTLRGQEARLYKHWAHEVSEEGNEIDVGSFAEAWEYKHFSWWREALDQEKQYISLLDTPVAVIAYKAGVNNWQNIFQPSNAVMTYSLAEEESEEDVLVMEEWVRQQIKEVLEPLVKPDFTVEHYRGVLRLCPQTSSARRSRLVDNETLGTVLKRMNKAARQLKEIYVMKADGKQAS